MRFFFLSMMLVCMAETAHAACSFYVRNLFGTDIYLDVLDEESRSVLSNPDLDFLKERPATLKKVEVRSFECNREMIFRIIDCYSEKVHESIYFPARRYFRNHPVFYIERQSVGSRNSKILYRVC